jgi:hypothetical protein
VRLRGAGVVGLLIWLPILQLPGLIGVTEGCEVGVGNATMDLQEPRTDHTG